MCKNKILLFLSLILVLSVSQAEEPASEVKPGSKPGVAKTKEKKKINLDFEEEVVKGASDAPDVMFLNTRRAVKYNELFDLRTNFIQETELNRGLFNDFKK